MTESGDRVEPFPLARRGTVDYMRVASRRTVVHGLVELDVTDAIAAIEARAAETGERRSLTAFLVGCLGRAIEAHPAVNAYRDWRGGLHTFEAVDVNVLIERPVGDRRVGVPHVLRSVTDRSLASIHDEIRSVQHAPGAEGPAG